VIIVMRSDATDGQVEEIVAHLEALRLRAHVSRGAERTIVGVVGITADKDALLARFSQHDAVASVVPISHSYKLVSGEGGRERSVVRLRSGATFGDRELAICAGPCSVESREQLMTMAVGVARAGASVLRGGAFKPRTSPYAFQGLGEEGLKLLREAADANGLGVVTEVLDVRDVDLVARYTDMLQIGARNMQNFPLLRAVGERQVPVLLKRGLSATIEEWLMAAEYIYVAGNQAVVLCERGIRSYDQHTRNLLDLAAVPLLRELTHLPIVVDPSHGTGVRRLVAPMSLAAVAAGADGLLIEVHPDPSAALSDGPQSLTLERFGDLMLRLSAVATAVGRTTAATAAV